VEVEVEAGELADDGEVELESKFYEALSPNLPSSSNTDSFLPQLGLVAGIVVAAGVLFFFIKKKLSGSKLEESIQGVRRLLSSLMPSAVSVYAVSEILAI
jgi:hypothetical protein